MGSKIKSYGLGLEAILNTIDANTQNSEINKRQKEFRYMMIHQIRSGKFQPRTNFDEEALKELSASIAAQGILQPIVIRESGKNQYEIIAGERRWRAAQMAGFQQIPAIICDITDEEALAFGLIENIQRQALNPIEEAGALKRLIDDFKMTHEQVAKSIGRSRTAITNTLRLLNLTKEVQKLLISKKLEVGHTKILLVFSAEEQNEIAHTIINKKMTVRAAEKFVQLKKYGIENIKNLPNLHSKCDEWSKILSEKLLSKTSVCVTESGIGKIEIHVNSLRRMEWLVDNLIQ